MIIPHRSTNDKLLCCSAMRGHRERQAHAPEASRCCSVFAGVSRKRSMLRLVQHRSRRRPRCFDPAQHRSRRTCGRSRRGAHLHRPQVLCAHAERRAVHAKRMFSRPVSSGSLWKPVPASVQQAGDPAVDPSAPLRTGLGAAAGRLGDAREDLEPCPERRSAIGSRRKRRFPRAVAADACPERRSTEVEGMPTTSPCLTSKDTSLSAQRSSGF